MNTLRLLVLTAVMALSLSGCAHHGPLLGAGLSPGVIVTNPVSQPAGAGNGFLKVVWTSSQSGQAGLAKWWVNPASQRPIPTASAVMIAGNMTVTFGPMAGYTPPPPKLVHVWKGQTTTLTVTYGQP
jgi:hypothetical protein